MSIVKQLTTVSEFERWQAYFEKKRTLHSKSDWYAAQTTWAIFASQGAKNINPKDYLLQFTPPRKRKRVTDPEKAWQESRNVWLGMFGIDPENPNG